MSRRAARQPHDRHNFPPSLRKTQAEPRLEDAPPHERNGDLQRAAHLILALYLLALTVATLGARSAGTAPATLIRSFQCIHRYEGSWTDPNAPYYGGLQMDYGFQQTYGAEYLRAWGTADHWPPSVQIAVAIRAYLSGRGFYPWPNSARECGLL